MDNNQSLPFLTKEEFEKLNDQEKEFLIKTFNDENWQNIKEEFAKRILDLLGSDINDKESVKFVKLIRYKFESKNVKVNTEALKYFIGNCEDDPYIFWLKGMLLDNFAQEISLLTIDSDSEDENYQYNERAKKIIKDSTNKTIQRNPVQPRNSYLEISPKAVFEPIDVGYLADIDDEPVKGRG